MQGLAFLFPPYTVYYLATRWGKMKPIVRRIATSCIPIVLVVLAYGFLPFVNPAAKDVKGFVPKVKAGAAEVETEIRSDLKKLEGEILRAHAGAEMIATVRPLDGEAIAHDNPPDHRQVERTRGLMI